MDKQAGKRAVESWEKKKLSPPRPAPKSEPKKKGRKREQPSNEE